jgi:three-Cys-motif partner protein
LTQASDFFDRRREWSRWKHELLRRYLPKFAGILGSRHSTVYYVDAFAGAGTYDGNPPVAGSPIIAATLGEAIAQGKWKYELRCINVEPHSRHFQELCDATSTYPLIENLRGTFKERLSEILAKASTYPTLLFIDPFGYKGMEWDAMARMAERARAAKTELLINFQSPKVDRSAGWLDSYGQPAQASFVDSLNELMGTDEWQPIIHAGLPKDERDAQLTNLYAGRLANLFKGIVSRYPVRTLHGQLKYYVLHVTGHQRGCREMSDVIYRVEEDYISERERATASPQRQLAFDDILSPPLTPDQIDANIAARLADDIYLLGKSRRQMRFGTIQDQLTTTDWFGQALEKHYRRACRLLIEAGKIAKPAGRAIDDGTVLTFICRFTDR